MNGALEWIGQIADWVGKFFPRWVILNPTEGAVKFVRGSRIVVCGAGIHWYWPVTTLWEMYPVARQADNLPTQTLVTLDDKTIAVGGMLVYRVDDLGKLLTMTHHPVRLVQDIALTAVHDVCCQLTWDQLKVEQRKSTLDTKLKNAAHRQLAEYGVAVIKCMLTDMAPTRVLKIIQSVNQDASV